MGNAHEVMPDLGRVAASGHSIHRPGRIGIANPNCCRNVWRVANEPRVFIVAGGSGLAASRTAETSCRARSRLDVLLKNV